MDNNIISKPALMRLPENGKKKRGRPKSPWVTYCQRTCKISRWWDDMGRLGEIADDRSLTWSDYVRIAA